MLLGVTTGSIYFQPYFKLCVLKITFGRRVVRCFRAVHQPHLLVYRSQWKLALVRLNHYSERERVVRMLMLAYNSLMYHSVSVMQIQILLL